MQSMSRILKSLLTGVSDECSLEIGTFVKLAQSFPNVRSNSLIKLEIIDGNTA